MPRAPYPNPEITISKTDARRFMLAHHHLWPPRQLSGKTGVLTYIRHVASIQFDPINIVGRNPDLVLQARVADYRPEMLDQLLYEDRHLIDGWDKMASIYPVEDWPCFLRYKNHIKTQKNARRPPQGALDDVYAEVKQRGPLSSLDFKETKKVDWYWGPTKMVRAALEYLYSIGDLGIDHRVNNRRAFDLIERLLPAEILTQQDPHENTQDYENWHVLRRVGSLGLAHPGAGEYWLGMVGMKSRQRTAALNHLAEKGELLPLAIEEIPDQTYFIRRTDLPTLENIQQNPAPPQKAALIGALDNLIWNRGLINDLFDFEYIWEVYKPKAQRRWGYYVLPIIYGDRFIARLEPAFDKKKRIFSLENWWWEDGIQPNETMIAALQAALADFGTYLNAHEIRLSKTITAEPSLAWIKDIR